MEEAPAFLKENYFRKNYGKKSCDKYRLKLFFVESYMGSLISRQKEYKLISDYIKNNGFESEAPVYFNEDRDLFFKKRIFPRAGLPKYRFKISFFKPAPGWDTIWLDRLKKIGH
jgi:hypothetical protein